MQAWKAAGFSVVGNLVFTKTYASKPAFVGYQHESAYLLAKGRPPLPAKPLPDVMPWQYTGNRHHRAEKPVSVLQPLIEMFTKHEDLILNPFADSGSTCVAADQCGRRWIGIELLEQYHTADLRRLGELRAALFRHGAGQGRKPGPCGLRPRRCSRTLRFPPGCHSVTAQAGTLTPL